MTERNAVDKLASLIVDRRTLPPPKLTGSSVPTGTDLTTKRDRLPLPFGDPGDVLTVIEDGPDKVTAWLPPAVTDFFAALVDALVAGSGITLDVGVSTITIAADGSGGLYWQYLVAADPDDDTLWGFLEARSGGQTMPIVAQFETE